jgi:predicted phage terminase large subunit-like protein
MASWNAQYQQEPIEREGTLFSPEDLRYYNGELPEGTPDRIFMAVDPAFGGGDFVSSPIAIQYGEDIYIPSVVYDNGDKQHTQPLLAKAAVDYSVGAMQIEANKSTEAYKEGVEKELKSKNYRMNITTKSAPPTTSKMARIFDKAPDIREHCIFLESGKRDKVYSQFMQNVFSYKITGRNKNDDAPDSLAMLIDMVLHPTNKVIAVKRPC